MKDAYYFSHDANAHNDPKMVLLRLKCKWEGIGLYWTFLEILRDIPDYKYPDKNFLASLEVRFSLPQATVQAWLEACLECGLLVKKDGFIYSESFLKRMAVVDKKRDIFREAGRRGGLKSSQAKATLKPGLRQAQAVKESKEKKIFIPPRLEEVIAFKNEINSKVDPQYFIDAYAKKDWMVGRNKMKDWKAAFRNAETWNCWDKDEPKTMRV